MIESLLYLAIYFKNKGKLDEAEIYCSRLLEFTGRVRCSLLPIPLSPALTVIPGKGGGQGNFERNSSVATAQQNGVRFFFFKKKKKGCDVCKLCSASLLDIAKSRLCSQWPIK
jgi:hypothetical protein